MTAQAVIFDLSTFQSRGMFPMRADIEAEKLLHEAIDGGSHCALVSDLPHSQADQRLRERFGEAAHHLFSVVLTDADFAARGHKSPYSTVLQVLGVDAGDALVVAASKPAAHAARLANIPLGTQGYSL
jgi:FMN phosphatase YigB (HAD superfamily)